MVNVLFVCLGNICRSPAAAAVLKKLCKDENVDVNVDSCAVADWSIGKSASFIMTQVMKKRGYQVDAEHKARLIEESDFLKFDYILAVDTSILERLNEIKPNETKSTVQLLTSFSDKYHNKDIIDPYQGIEVGYISAADMIEDSCQGIVNELKKQVRQ